MKTSLEFSLAAMTFLLAGWIAGTSSESAAAPSGLSTVDDVVGDSSHPAAYMDVVSAKVQEKNDGLLYFFIEVDGTIPDAPQESSLVWPVHVDTNPDASPGGLYVDHVPRAFWNGTNFVGEVVHRSTTKSGKLKISITTVPFEIDGDTIRLTVDPALLGNPSSFRWNASTRPSTAPGVAYSDFAGPDGSCPLATAGPAGVNCLATWTAE